MELQENADNVDLLLTVLSMILEEFPDLTEPIKDHEVVNHVLGHALKGDKIPAGDLGLVLTYLETVQAPSIYFQYAILRVHQNI